MSGVVVFDLETQDLARSGRLPRISVAVTFEERARRYRWYTEDRVSELVRLLQGAALVVGFNLYGFDYPVLQAYTDVPLRALPTLDILEDVRRSLGRRVSLNHLCRATLGMEKAGSGLLAVRWWQTGQLDRLVAYCVRDVALTWRLFDFGRRNGHLLYRDPLGGLRPLPVDWARHGEHLGSGHGAQAL